MRRLIFLLIFIVGTGSAIFFLAGDQISGALGGGGLRYVVATRDIPPYSVITEDAVALREVSRGQTVPEGAILDSTSGSRGNVIPLVISKASPQAIPRGQPVRMDQIFPFDMLQRTRGVTMVLARERIEVGRKLDSSLFRAVFRDSSQVPRGAVISSVNERIDSIFEKVLPENAWANTVIEADQPLTLNSISFVDPSSFQNRVVSEQGGRGPLDLNAPIPKIPRSELLARLAATPGAFRLNDGPETEAIAGTLGPIDLFVSPARIAMKSSNLEVHRRLFIRLRLYVFSSDEAGSLGQPPVIWVRLDPEIQADLERRRASGALITAVPSGGSLPSQSGSAVMCANQHVCYRGLTVEPAPPISSSGPGIDVPRPGHPQGGGPWAGGVGTVPQGTPPPQQQQPTPPSQPLSK